MGMAKVSVEHLKGYAVVFVILIAIGLLVFTHHFPFLNNTITGKYTQEECDLMCVDNTQPEICDGFPRTYNLTQDQNSIIHLCGIDDQSDEIHYATDESKGVWDSLYLYPNGTLNITPVNLDVGARSIFIIPLDDCSDPDICGASDVIAYRFTFNVSNVNDPPLIENANPQNSSVPNGAENETYTFYVNITDEDYLIDPAVYNETFNYSFFVDENLNVSGNNTRNITYQFDYIPGWYDAGEHNITFLVYDKEGANTSYSWILYVNNTNRLPVQEHELPNVSLYEHANSSDLNLSYYFSDEDEDDILQFEINVTEGLNYSYSLINESYILNFISVPYWYGNQTVFINMSDGTLETRYDYISSNNFTVEVLNVNDAPIIEEIEDQAASSNATYSLQLNVTDPDSDDLYYWLEDEAAWIEIDQSGLISGFAPLGSEGNYLFTAFVSDNNTEVLPYNQTSNISINLTVFANSPPEFIALNNLTTTQGNTTTLYIDVSDPESDDFELTSNATWTLEEFNETRFYFEFTPAQEEVGNNTIELTATDEWGLSTIAILQIEVLDLNFPPVLDEIGPLIAKIARVNPPKSFSYDVNASDSDGDTLTYALNFTPPLNIDNETGMIYASFGPSNSEYEGIHYVNISVNDNSFGEDYEVVELTITYNRNPVLSSLGNYTVEEDTEFILQINATDEDLDNLTFYSNDTIGLNETTGLLNYTHTSPGVFVYNISVFDNDDGWDYEILTLNVTEENDPPVINSSNLNVTTMEDNLTIIYVEFFDEEGNDITLYDNASEFNFTKINNTLGIINYTPDVAGDFSYELIASDSSENGTAILNVTVLPYNYPPELYSFSPGLIINAYERDVINFSLNVSDPDGDNLTYTWSFDGEEIPNENSSNLTYQLGWFDAGSRQISVSVKDIYNQESNGTPLNWGLTVLNLNRAPYFGQYIFTNFTNGTFEGTEEGSLSLLYNGTDYNEVGNYTSPVIDFGSEGFIHLNNLTYIAEWVPDGDVSFLYRYSLNNPPPEYLNTLTWTSWQEFVNETYNGSTGIMTLEFQNASDSNVTYDSRYLQIKILLNTTNTQRSITIKNFTINYEIAVTTIEQGSYANHWITLSTFFKDYDTDDTLSYNFTSINSDLNVYIPAGLSYAKIEPNSSSFVGEDYVNVTVSDGNETVESNLAKVIVTRKESSGETTQYLVRTVTKTTVTEVPVEEEVPVYKEFNLLVPETMTMYDNDTVIIPILLDNTGNDTLYDVVLSAETEMAGVDLSFSKNNFPAILPGTKENTSLIVTSYKTQGSYDIVISANSREPAFNDTTKIMMATIEAGEYDENQFNTKVAFTRDLINDNQECIELSEMISRAETYFLNDNPERAKQILNSAIESCRYLITSKEFTTEMPDTKIQAKKENPLIFFGVSILIAMTVLLVVLFFMKKSKD